MASTTFIAALAALIAVASAGLPAARYPANVHPGECPNYPYCHDGLHGNHAVATHKSGLLGVAPAIAVGAPGNLGAYGWAGAAGWAAGAPGWAGPAGWAAGRWAGVPAIAAAPAVPYAYGHGAAVVPAAALGAGAKYPAAVSPAECPGYPYCHDGYHGNHVVGAASKAAVVGHGVYAAGYHG